MGAVFCDDATPHDGHDLLPGRAGNYRCPGRGLQEDDHGDEAVCASCGRYAHQQDGPDCDTPDWHVLPEPPAPRPDPGGLELVLAQGQRVQHLEEELRSVYRVLYAIVATRRTGTVRVALEAVAEGNAGGELTSWRDEATGELVLAVHRG